MYKTLSTAATAVLYLLGARALALAPGAHAHAHEHARRSLSQMPLSASTLRINGIDASTRAYWMRQANRALAHACPFAAFGTVIVNHTDDTSGLGRLVCTGANANSVTGNPAMHGTSLFFFPWCSFWGEGGGGGCLSGEGESDNVCGPWDMDSGTTLSWLGTVG